MSRMDKTTAYTKGAKKRARKARKAMDDACALAPIPRRERNGRASRVGVTRDPQVEMLKARARRWGFPVGKWREMRDPWWGCEAGGAMAKATPKLDDRKALWDAICYMRRAAVAFDAVIGAPQRHAQCLRLLLPVERLEADGETPEPDDRTDEEREDDAVRAMQWVQELTGRAGPDASGEALRAVLDDQRPRDVVAMIMALRQVSYGIDPRALTLNAELVILASSRGSAPGEKSAGVPHSGGGSTGAPGRALKAPLSPPERGPAFNPSQASLPTAKPRTAGTSPHQPGPPGQPPEAKA